MILIWVPMEDIQAWNHIISLVLEENGFKKKKSLRWPIKHFLNLAHLPLWFWSWWSLTIPNLHRTGLLRVIVNGTLSPKTPSLCPQCWTTRKPHPSVAWKSTQTELRDGSAFSSYLTLIKILEFLAFQQWDKVDNPVWDGQRRTWEAVNQRRGEQDSPRGRWVQRWWEKPWQEDKAGETHMFRSE